MTDAETFFREFHAARPGVTAKALARAGSYERLAAQVPPLGRVLDLGCGDDHLISRIGPRAVGIDLAPSKARGDRQIGEGTAKGPRSPSAPRGILLGDLGDLGPLAVQSGSGTGRLVRGRAQTLPFRDGSFSAVTCHLAFMLFDDVDTVVAELARVLAPGGQFLALVGGGPTAEGTEETDAFHAFASLLWERQPDARGFGDRRASTETGWSNLFGGWTVLPFERWELDLSGSFDDVWRFLGASYQLAESEAPQVRDQLRRRFAGERVPCKVATYFARAIRR